MKIILEVERCSAGRMEQLEAQGLLTRLLRPAGAAAQATPGTNVGVPLYVTRDEFGPHTLLSVGINATELQLTTHPTGRSFSWSMTGARRGPWCWCSPGTQGKKC